MTINNLITNGDFETGMLTPWVGLNASITTTDTHSGYYAASLSGELSNSYIYQIAPANPGENLLLLISLAKVGTATSAPVSITVAFYDASFTFLDYGLILEIPANDVPDNLSWLVAYKTTSVAPSGTTQALILINSLPPVPGAPDILVDDVDLITVTSTTVALTSSKYFSTVGSGVMSGGNLIIPAGNFTDDNGAPIVTFPPYTYFNLYINGFLEPNGTTNLSPSQLEIQGGDILDPRDPITIELVRSV